MIYRYSINAFSVELSSVFFDSLVTLISKEKRNKIGLYILAFNCCFLILFSKVIDCTNSKALLCVCVGVCVGTSTIFSV